MYCLNPSIHISKLTRLGRCLVSPSVPGQWYNTTTVSQNVSFTPFQKYFIFPVFGVVLGNSFVFFISICFLSLCNNLVMRKKFHFLLLLNFLCHFWEIHWGNHLLVAVWKVTDKEYSESPCKYSLYKSLFKLLQYFIYLEKCSKFVVPMFLLKLISLGFLLLFFMLDSHYILLYIHSLNILLWKILSFLLFPKCFLVVIKKHLCNDIGITCFEILFIYFTKKTL